VSIEVLLCPLETLLGDAAADFFLIIITTASHAAALI